jgi:hypothetical protein
MISEEILSEHANLSQRALGRQTQRNVKRAKRAAACLLMTTRHPLGQIEAQLLQHTPENSAAGPIRQVAGRTRDVLEVVAAIATYFGKTLADEAAVDDLVLQLEIGLPRESLDLARILGTQLVRGDYLGLLAAGISTWEAVEPIPREQLVELVGASRAALLKDAAHEQLASP